MVTHTFDCTNPHRVAVRAAAPDQTSFPRFLRHFACSESGSAVLTP